MRRAGRRGTWSQCQLVELDTSLFMQHDDEGKRVDIEESQNLASKMPEKATEMNRLLQLRLDEMQADTPYKNPYYKNLPPSAQQAPLAKAKGQSASQVWMTYQERGNSLAKAYLMYTTNGGQKSEEWQRMDASFTETKVSATFPQGTTHYIFNLIDEQNFLVSYPRMGQVGDFKRGNYSTKAFKVK